MGEYCKALWLRFDDFGQGAPRPDIVKLTALQLDLSSCLLISATQLLINLKRFGSSLLATTKSEAQGSQTVNSLPSYLDPAAWQIGEWDELNKWLLDRSQPRLQTPCMTVAKLSFGNPDLMDFIVHHTAGGSEVVFGAQDLMKFLLEPSLHKDLCKS